MEIVAEAERLLTPTVVALIAHDEKKQELLRLIRSHRRLLSGLRLIATGTTGALFLAQYARVRGGAWTE